MIASLLITGPTSYIGSSLCCRLEQAGISFVAVSHHQVPFQSSEMARMISKASHIVHLAHPAGDGAVQQAKEMAEFLLRHMQPSARMIYLSSIAVYGHQPFGEAIPEGTTKNPLTLNGQSKLAAEQTILHHDNHLILRVAALWGLEARKYVAGSVLRKLRYNHPVQLTDNGLLMRDFVHVDDVCQIIIDHLETDVKGIFNIGSGHAISMREFVESLKDQVQSESPVELSNEISGAVVWAVPDITRAKEVLNVIIKKHIK